MTVIEFGLDYIGHVVEMLFDLRIVSFLHAFLSLEGLLGMCQKGEKMEGSQRQLRPDNYQLQPSTYLNCSKASPRGDFP